MNIIDQTAVYNTKQINPSQNSPGRQLMTSRRLSSVLMVLWKPHSASTRVSSFCMIRSVPRRRNWGCSFSSSTMTMSPGSKPGSWSPSPAKRICCPSLIPAQVNKMTAQPLSWRHTCAGTKLWSVIRAFKSHPITTPQSYTHSRDSTVMWSTHPSHMSTQAIAQSCDQHTIVLCPLKCMICTLAKWLQWAYVVQTSWLWTSPLAYSWSK